MVNPVVSRNPQGSKEKLKLFNSFTKKKENFVPRGDVINWYNCGPTVYDISHMGHARCYISFDIIRRVLQNYYGYKINFVQNITDIDDKIIKRARQNYLWNQYREKLNQNGINDEFNLFLENAFEYHRVRISKEEDLVKKKFLEKQLQQAVEHHFNLDDIDQYCRNVLVEWLDNQLGATVVDNSIFEILPREFEADFYQDMDQLNILRPDHAPRVSESITQIIEFVEKIIFNGFAYVSNGSVYFDTHAFNSNPKHKYGKLAPEAIGNMSALNEGEGDLSNSEDKLQEKKNANDFALWKCSKPGEPSWLSPWGFGRPGWHIECSAMACGLLGEFADIHSGGIDLRFPHHENEIAQTEAFFNTGSNWIKYFLHTGHLHIEGCKMSKSLKNFVSIKEALKQHTARQIRMAFLLHSWEDPLDYSRKTMQEALSYEKSFKEYFFAIENYKTNSKEINDTISGIGLKEEFEKVIDKVDDALCDNFNTKQVLLELRNLISYSNIYMKETKSEQANHTLLYEIGQYLTDILKVFGVIEDAVQFGMGCAEKGASLSKKEIIMPYVKAICQFREKVRNTAKKMKAGELLSLCDELRDQILPILGIEIDDKETNGVFQTVIKIDEEQLLKSPETIRKEEEEKRKQREEKQREKEAKKAEQEKLREEKENQKKIPPSQMFLKEIDKYSKFDENGIPTHDAQGKEISKGQQKKLQKLYQLQEKKYNEYIATLEK